MILELAKDLVLSTWINSKTTINKACLGQVSCGCKSFKVSSDLRVALRFACPLVHEIWEQRGPHLLCSVVERIGRSEWACSAIWVYSQNKHKARKTKKKGSILLEKAPRRWLGSLVFVQSFWFSGSWSQIIFRKHALNCKSMKLWHQCMCHTEQLNLTDMMKLFKSVVHELRVFVNVRQDAKSNPNLTSKLGWDPRERKRERVRDTSTGMLPTGSASGSLEDISMHVWWSVGERGSGRMWCDYLNQLETHEEPNSQ